MNHRISFLFGLTFCFAACQPEAEEIRTLAASVGLPEIKAAINNSNNASPVATNLLLQSEDGGSTWQDLSAGLPVGLFIEGMVVTHEAVLLGADDGLFRRDLQQSSSEWDNVIFLREDITGIFPGRLGVYASSMERGFFQNLPLFGFWLPVFESLQSERIRCVYEHPGGYLLAGTDRGIFKSNDDGETWAKVHPKTMVWQFVQIEDHIFASSESGMLHSTNNGDQWEQLTADGSKILKITPVNDGISAIVEQAIGSSDSKEKNLKHRRLLFSSDDGTTWQAMDENLKPSMILQDVEQLGENLFCTSNYGIFRSGDGGKTWALIHGTNGLVYELEVSGGKIFAVMANVGC